MLYQEKNDYGVITIDDSLLRQIIDDTLAKFKGKVFLCNKYGVLFDKINILGLTDSLSFIDYSKTDKGVFIKIYLSVVFGESLSNIANSIISDIFEILNSDLCIKIDDIQICVSSVMTSKASAKRNILFSLNNVSNY